MGIYLPMVDGDVIAKWDKEFVTNTLKKISKQQTVNKIRTIKINKLFNLVIIIYHMTIELHQKLFV